MKFKFVPHTADVQFEAYGRTINEAFQNAASAMFDVITNTRKVKPKISKKIKVKSEDNESLLYDFLQKLLILHETEHLLFSKFLVKVTDNTLTASAKGEKINKERHELRTGVKAITYHNMKVSKIKGGWKATAVIDI